MRPDVAALHELESLVRNLSEQLAGFRRRALSAETRVRELEQILAGMNGKLDEVRQQAEDMQQSRDAALVEARTLESQVAMLRRDLTRWQSASPSAASASTTMASHSAPVPESAPRLVAVNGGGDVSSLEEENLLLKGRLTEARERTARLGERVRFLRQQVNLGVER